MEKKPASTVPEARVRPVNEASLRDDGEFVLYWMTAFRRPNWNFALDRAVDLARGLGKPLVVLEALRCGYEWASDRHHRFVLDGMAFHERHFADTPALYYPYVEGAAGEGSGLLEALAARACAVVTDDYPCLFLPRMVAAAGRKLDVALDAVDSDGLLPLRATDKVFPTAHSFRRFLQKELPAHLDASPRARLPWSSLKPWKGGLGRDIEKRWPRARPGDIDLAALPLDHDVGVAPATGGNDAARRTWRAFLDGGLAAYDEDRNVPDLDASSGLSPWLHFGHVSTHELVHDLTKAEDWHMDKLSQDTSGSRSGWWGMSPSAEAFLDQLVTWRELGFNRTAHSDDYADFDSLPDWALRTLADHAGDEREHTYTRKRFAAAETHDELWNAAQRQLAREGRLHNYMRMLWGKKILEWSKSPRDALRIMLDLNNRYALDGRDPNSYSGIFWVLGRYDRPWGPERPIFGKVRYMSSENTARKHSVKAYLDRYGPA